MSLEEQLDGALLESTVKGLDTIASMSNRMIKNECDYAGEDVAVARVYQREFNHAVWTNQVSQDLRDNFLHISTILAGETQSRAHGIMDFLMVNAAAAAFVGILYESPLLIVSALGGGFFARTTQKNHDREEGKRLYAEAERVYNASDVYWKEALDRLNEKRSNELKS